MYKYLSATFVTLLIGCSVDIDAPQTWSDLSCDTDADCTGVVINNICDRVAAGACADIALHTKFRDEYYVLLADAETSCWVKPANYNDSSACEESYACKNATCVIGPL
jgi:hypothetical protein